MTQTQIEIPRWTAPEFERLVFASKPKVAVFDCDGTLWGGDAGYGFMAWSLEKGLVSRSTCDWVDTRYRDYLAGNVSELDICGEMVQIYAGLRDQELREAAARYVRKFVQPRVFAEMAALVAALKKAGVEIWAVSSTNKWVVAEGVRDFGIPEERILAAEVRVTDGPHHQRNSGRAHRRGQGRHAQARGNHAPRCGLRQLHPRPGHAGDGAQCLPGQSLSGTARGCGKERLGLLYA